MANKTTDEQRVQIVAKYNMVSSLLIVSVYNPRLGTSEFWDREVVLYQR